MRIKILSRCCNEDWKTALAHRQSSIPAGTILDVYDITCNCYGRYFDVVWDGSVRSIKMRDCQLVGPVDSAFAYAIPADLYRNAVKS